MKGLRFAAVLAALALPLVTRANAQREDPGPGVEVGIGADWLVKPDSGEFQLTLAGDRALLPFLTLGVRGGVLLTTDPSHVGVPLDLRVRIHGNGFYVDGLLGPWFVFASGDTVRFHGAIGVGLRRGRFSAGIEVGELHDTSMLGLRFAFLI